MSNLDGEVKSSGCKARKSEGMRRTYRYAAMTEDAVQRSRWAFYDAVIHKVLFHIFGSVCILCHRWIR